MGHAEAGVHYVGAGVCGSCRGGVGGMGYVGVGWIIQGWSGL